MATFDKKLNISEKCWNSTGKISSFWYEKGRVWIDAAARSTSSIMYISYCLLRYTKHVRRPEIAF